MTKLDKGNEALTDLVERMLDSYTIRQSLKTLISATEEKENIWFMKQIFGAIPEDPGGDLFFKR